jgi:thiamine pyrophosphate-dependent acetolactate synthase large subunit-like protein
VETSDNVDEALDALLEEAKPHVVDFLSDRQVPGRKPQAAASIRKQLQDL